MNTFAGATTSGQYLRGNGSNVVMSAIQAGDVPTLNQNTTGSAGSVANAVTFTSSGGAGAGTTFNGSAARTIDYSTVGAPSTTGAGASGTWPINISGTVSGSSSIGAIGNCVAAIYGPPVNHPATNDVSLSVGDTVQGSTLWYNFSQYTVLVGRWDFDLAYIVQGSSAVPYPNSGTSLSGTWRCIARPGYGFFSSTTNTYSWYPGLFVRVS
jgi:hypothetical protein